MSKVQNLNKHYTNTIIGDKMKKIIWTLSIVLITAFAFQNSFAQRGNFGKENEPRMNRIDQLNLTDAQQKKIQDLRLANQEQMIKFRSDIQIKELEIRKLKNSDNISRSELTKLTKELSQIKTDMELARINHQMDVYDNLDANQKKIWSEQNGKREIMKNKMKGNFSKRRR